MNCSGVSDAPTFAGRVAFGAFAESTAGAAGEAAQEIKLRTRQYAKRQLTWFRRNRSVHWFLWGRPPIFEQAIAFSTQVMAEYGLV